MKYLKRYGPAFMAATMGSLGGGLVAHYLFGSSVITALAATWGENIGYYGLLFYSDSLERYRRDQRFSLYGNYKVLRNLVVEFGPAELIDTFIVRPLIIYVFVEKIPGPLLGIFIGKVVSDIFFYLPTIVMFNFRKKYLDD